MVLWSGISLLGLSYSVTVTGSLCNITRPLVSVLAQHTYRPWAFTAEVRAAEFPSCGKRGLKHGMTSSERDLRPQRRCQLQMEGTPGWIKPVIHELPLVSEPSVTALSLG